MSHWTKIKTNLKDQDLITKALDRMGISYQVGNHSITQYGTTEKAEIKMDDAVGLSEQKDGTWAMVGDFYHSRKRELSKYYSRGEQFNVDLTTNYAIEEAQEALTAQGFFCSDNEEAEVGDDGMIRMTFENWG